MFESLPLSHRTRFASARKSSDSIKSETFSFSCNKITDSVISAIGSDFVKRSVRIVHTFSGMFLPPKEGPFPGNSRVQVPFHS
jgi:hypothetical protein